MSTNVVSRVIRHCRLCFLVSLLAGASLLVSQVVGDEPPESGSADDESQAAVKSFRQADEDSSGTLTRRELANFLKSQNLGDNRSVRRVFRELDIDRDQEISESEFVRQADHIESILDGQSDSRGGQPYSLDDPGKQFVPITELSNRIDDQAIFAALMNRHREWIEGNKKDWPRLQFDNLPQCISSSMKFGPHENKPTVRRIAAATLILMAGRERVGTGGAVLVSEDGTAVTNYHVAEMAKKAPMTALTSAGTSHRVVSVLAGNPDTDVALIRIEGRGFPFVPVAKQLPEAGDDIVMLHHSENRFYTYDRGYVRRISKIGRNTRMEISADYAPGGSGCGIYNAAHELIGLVCEINMGDGPTLASGGSGDPREEQFIVVKHAVHLSAIQSLWKSSGDSATSSTAAAESIKLNTESPATPTN